MNGSDSASSAAPDALLSDDAWLAEVRLALGPSTSRLGAYELLGPPRRGAQAIVYRAIQPHTQRIVALKRLLDGAVASNATRLRFEREMAAASSLRHPNIVTVYGLEVIEGQPVLAMEWIDGLSVDRWMRESSRSDGRPLAERLVVFEKICDAIEHAHGRGVLHRDLKPSNVLVDAAGEPHVLDFGLAKRLGATDDCSRLTAAGDFLGTPIYAAPEQVQGRNDDVDVRTDVYALGGLLYEFITDRPPFHDEHGIAALFDAIRDREPTRPSSIVPHVDADLEAIVLRALAKSPDQRYPTVEAFRADLRRYTSGQAVEARGHVRWYRLRKALQRHRGAAAIAAAFLALAVTSIVWLYALYTQQGTLLSQVGETASLEAAQRERAERVQAVLEQTLVQVSQVGRAVDLPLREQMLSGSVQMIEQQLADSPEALAAAIDAIGRAYQMLGLYDPAESCLRRSLDLRVRHSGPESLSAATSMDRLAGVLQDRSRYADAEPLFREALRIRRAALAEPHVDIATSLHHLGTVFSNRQLFVKAIEAYRAARDMREKLLGENHVDSIASLHAVGCAEMNLSRFDAAEAAFREVLRRLSASEAPERASAEARVNLGKVLVEMNRPEEAEIELRSALEALRRLLGDHHDNVAWAAHRLGRLLVSRGCHEEGETLLRESLAIYRAVLGETDPFVASVCDSLAEALSATNRESESAAFRAQAESIRAALANGQGARE
ncbi:MAG: hypothetical protein AMXMBFR47_35690 [Planctomycetota bacterium]